MIGGVLGWCTEMDLSCGQPALIVCLYFSAYTCIRYFDNFIPFPL